MSALKIKGKWQAGEPSPGMWIRLTDPTILDMLADIGFDWVIIDAEHQAYNPQTLQMLLIALKGSSTVPLVRVAGTDHAYIKQVLDFGAAGVLVPQIRTTEEVMAAVAACKYPPTGIRGAGPRRPSRYGRQLKEYLTTANELTIVLIMVETIEAVENIDAILAVPDLDGIITGPSDLSISMGFYGDQSRSEVQAAIGTIIEKARAARMPFGSGVPAMYDPTDWIDLGAQIIAIGDDEQYIQLGAEAAMKRFQKVIK